MHASAAVMPKHMKRCVSVEGLCLAVRGSFAGQHARCAGDVHARTSEVQAVNGGSSSYADDRRVMGGHARLCRCTPRAWYERCHRNVLVPLDMRCRQTCCVTRKTLITPHLCASTIRHCTAVCHWAPGNSVTTEGALDSRSCSVCTMQLSLFYGTSGTPGSQAWVFSLRLCFVLARSG